MATVSPVFPLPQSQHFSDYGFDPQIDYFQVLEEARKHKCETMSRSIDSIHFRLRKPISKDDYSRPANSKRKKRWWRSALLFFKRRTWTRLDIRANFHLYNDPEPLAFRASIAGPVYTTEGRSGSSRPYRTSSSSSSGPLAGILKGEIDIPYLSLRELNIERQQKMPIYLVT